MRFKKKMLAVCRIWYVYKFTLKYLNANNKICFDWESRIISLNWFIFVGLISHCNYLFRVVSNRNGWNFKKYELPTFFSARIFYLQCSDFYGTLRASTTSVKTRVYANTRACKFLLHSTLAASLSRIYQTLLTMYWHCDVIDLPIYLGTEKWLNVSFSQRDGRSIPFSTINERFNSIARLCKDRNWYGVEFEETWEQNNRATHSI